MMAQDDIRRLLHRLAAHPVLPPTDRLPPNDEALHALLADLASGERSRCADMLRSVADECGIAAKELAHRAEFLLACLILPRAGTYYEVLGVAPTASADEIRRRWSALIQRYHPDHMGGSGGWVDDQARRLIEAYQTLKDPERRRRYDAALEHQRAAIATPSLVRRAPRLPQRWRWVPLVLMLLGSAGVLAIYAWCTPPPLPQMTLPPAPKLLEARQQAAFADALALARSLKPSATVVEEASGQAPVPVPEEGQASVSVPISPPVNAPVVAAPQDQKPSEMPRPAVKPPKSSTSSGRRLETTPIHGSVPRQAQHDEEGGTPRIFERIAVRPEPDISPIRPESFDKLRTGTVEERTAAKDTPIDFPQGEPFAFAQDRLVKGQLPLVKMQPMVARTKPDDSWTEGRLPAEHPLALIETFRAAYEGKDLSTMMRLFASVPRERSAVGRSAVQALYARNFVALDQIQYELSHLVLAPPAANGGLVVQGWFRIRAVRRDNPSDLVIAAGAIRWVLRPEADALRIAEIDYELSRP
jgi:DnaJ domain